MYDPELKRFLSADPHVTFPGFGQSWNPYSYVLNSPLNFTDPSGFEPAEVCSSLGACYPTGDGTGTGTGSSGGDKASDYWTSGPFATSPAGSAGDTSTGGGGGGRDVAKSDGGGTRQAGESVGAGIVGAGALALPAAEGALGGGAAAAVPVGLTGALGASALGAILAPITAFLGITFYDRGTIVADDVELGMLAMAKAESDKKKKAGTGTTAIPKPNEKENKWYVVRVQAQGSGLEKSVAIRQPVPVTIAQGLAALAALQAQLTPGELKLRDIALDKAAKWIYDRAPYGAGPPGMSDFNNPGVRGNVARIDVEILMGVNFEK
jgi:hypothetical protein